MIYHTYNDNNGNVRGGDINIFLETCIDLYLNSQKIKIRSDELNRIKEKIIDPSDGMELEITPFDHLEELFEIHHQLTKFTIQGVVLLSTFIEALINEIGNIELGDKYYQEHLDKLSVISKWEIVLKLIYGKSINKGSHHFENVNKVIKTRNYLVHYKTDKVDASSKKNKIDYFDILNKGINSLGFFVEELKEIDKDKRSINFYFIDLQLKRIIPAHNNM